MAGINLNDILSVDNFVNKEEKSDNKKIVLDTSHNPTAEEKAIKKRKQSSPVSVNGEIVNNNGDPVADADYARSYEETNSLIKSAIYQADELSSEIKKDIEDVRSSKTIKNKYTYLTNLTASASSLLMTKIGAIKELNSSINNVHRLNLDRMKALKLDQKEEVNDERRMLDIYSAFVNAPVGAYTPTAPTLQDLNLGVNGANPSAVGVEMVNPQNQGGPLTPEQNRMRMEANVNVQTVVKFNQATGQRYFDVIDKSTGASIPNYPRPDTFLLEDTTIDVHSGIARNRNINTVWPLVVEGTNGMPLNEY